MLTADQTLDLVNRLGQAGLRGRTAALRRFNQTGMGSTNLTPAQLKFLDAVDKVAPVSRSTYAHPAEAASFAPARENKPLTPSELAWLQRLPADPTKVPFADAQKLFTLVNSVQSPDDNQLLRSIADPVREYHDGKKAEVDLANASAPVPPAPHEALAAVADAVASELDQLEPHEVVARAGEMLHENGQRRVAEQHYKINTAQQRVDQLKAAAAARVAVHR